MDFVGLMMQCQKMWGATSRILFSDAICQKALTPKAFQTHAELKQAVTKYTNYNLVDADELAETYGWPIDRLDVSNIQNFDSLFIGKRLFNENIGSWNTSNITCPIWIVVVVQLQQPAQLSYISVSA
eukprot:scaffold349877_cov27-Attheya_sp.AAC.2